MFALTGWPSAGDAALGDQALDRLRDRPERSAANRSTRPPPPVGTTSRSSVIRPGLAARATGRNAIRISSRIEVVIAASATFQV